MVPDLSYADLSRKANIANYDMTNCNLLFCIFGDISGIDFSGSDMRNSRFSDITIANSDFSEADLRFGNFSGSVIMDCHFENSRLEECSFDDVRVDYSIYNNCKLNKSKLSLTTFMDCEFENSNFENLNLEGVLFINCNLTGSSNLSTCFAEGLNIILDHNTMKKSNGIPETFLRSIAMDGLLIDFYKTLGLIK